ncbi:MAG: hypothetical protein QOJ00_1479 [Actinomycetota bacterium]
MSATAPIGERFARALAVKDRDTMHALLSPDVDFRALTPNRFWEANDAAEVVDGILLGSWFGPTDHIAEVLAVECSTVSHRERVAYRFHVTNADGDHVVEQQAYIEVTDGRISWMRVLCAGVLPLG